MKANANLTLRGTACTLVPYKPEHVPLYHEWMKDPEMQEATASEPLSIDEEYTMQRDWADDEKSEFGCLFFFVSLFFLSILLTAEVTTTTNRVHVHHTGPHRARQARHERPRVGRNVRRRESLL
jgi:hypothetical protein